MLPLILAAGMMAKNQLVDKPKEEKDRKLQAITAQYSPWTGMTPQAVKNTSAVDAGLQGAGAGLSMQQGMDMQSAQLDALKSQSDYYNRAGQGGQMSPSMVMPMGGQSYGPARGKKGAWDYMSGGYGNMA